MVNDHLPPETHIAPHFSVGRRLADLADWVRGADRKSALRCARPARRMGGGDDDDAAFWEAAAFHVDLHGNKLNACSHCWPFSQALIAEL